MKRHLRRAGTIRGLPSPYAIRVSERKVPLEISRSKTEIVPVTLSPRADRNVCGTKKLTNMRAAGKDDTTRLAPPRIMSLEECLEYVEGDELVEVTPKSLRLRKRILDPEVRKKSKKRTAGV